MSVDGKSPNKAGNGLQMGSEKVLKIEILKKHDAHYFQRAELWANASAIETNGIKLMSEAVRGHACQRIGWDMCLSDRNKT